MRSYRARHRAPRSAYGFLLVFLSAVCSLLSPAGQAAQAPASQADLLHQLSAASEALVKKVAPSVVQVVVTGYAALDEKGHGETGLVIGRQRSIGSGVIIDSDGYIMTNAHVVGSGGRIQVVLPPLGDTTAIPGVLNARARVLEARLVGVSRNIDLALLKIEAAGLLALPMGRYPDLRQGEIVFAFGSPEGLRNSVTMGVVSSVARQLDPDSPLIYIQTDAPINPGNSGGPLVNPDGQMVGLSTFILTQSGGSEGLGFAIPSGLVAFAYPQLRKYGHVHRGEIGASVQTITPTMAAALKLARDWGVIVADVVPGGPADAAGLKIGDIVLNAGGRAIDSLPIFGFTLFTQEPGAKVKFEVLRGSEKASLEIPVAERPHNVDRLTDLVDPQKNLVPKLGILAIEISDQVADIVSGLRISSGVIVVAKYASSDWAENSLTTGDVIHAVNGTPVTSLAGLDSALAKLDPGDPLVLQVEREERLTFLTVHAQ